ncbi:MAG: cache domain-containing protein [bacterium]
MKATTLKRKIIVSVQSVILVLSISLIILGYFVIKNNIIARAQRQVYLDLRAARIVYTGEIDKIKNAFSLLSDNGITDIEEARKKIGIDYLFVVPKEQKYTVKSEIARTAFLGKGIGGTRIIGTKELEALGTDVYQRTLMEIKETPKARPSDDKLITKAMAIEYAIPIHDKSGNISKVIYGGKIINRDFELIDRIHGLVFEKDMYKGKPIGTVTIFQNDVRIATNVLDNYGNRAVGTRVSQTVYEKVVDKGERWIDRAFVVTDWYLTAYEPIRDINGKIIGVLYVGLLEQIFRDIIRNILLIFLAIIIGAAIVAEILSHIIANSISRQLTNMTTATGQIANGDLSIRVQTDGSVKELNTVATAFNEMAGKLAEREQNLKTANDKLETLNKSYLDLIGFVSHELKGILASTILNAYAVRDGFLGMINYQQRKALDSVVRHLDYFSATVKNFLNLSRIEKEEMQVHKRKVMLKEDVFDFAIEEFAKPASEKNIQIINQIESALPIVGEKDMLLIVANNLVGNAVKYGNPGGKIILSTKSVADKLQIEVYNDGRPITTEEKDKLFKKFSRLSSPESKKAQGTGLGLFITKQIIDRHGGSIWVEPREAGNAFIFQLEKGK